MFNAARMAVTVAVLALVGSLAYVAAPTHESAIAPGAPMRDASDFAGFSGTFKATGGTTGELTAYDWGHTIEGAYYAPMTLDVSDERLSGTARATHNAVRFKDGAGYGVRTLRTEIVNDGGTWEGTGLAFHDQDAGLMRYEFLLSGSGEYEGLSALLSLVSDSALIDHDAMGVIFPGELPPRPVRDDVEMPAAWTGEIHATDSSTVDGTMLCAQGWEGSVTGTEWGSITEGEEYPRCIMQVSDERFGGSSHSVHDYYRYGGQPKWGVRAASDVISNDEGTWVGGGWGYQHPETGVMHYVDTYRGTGAYEGLSALQVLSQDQWGFSFDSDGVIFPGELPPYPELPPAE